MKDYDRRSERTSICARARARGEGREHDRDVSIDGRPKLTLPEEKEKECVSLSPESDDAPLTRDVSRTARATPLAGRDRRAFQRDRKSDFQLTCICVGRRRKIRRTGTKFSHAQTRNLDRQSRRNGESRGCVVIERAAAILRTSGHLSAERARRWFTRETL